MFKENIESTTQQLKYHRDKSKRFFRVAWVFSFLSFAAILMFAAFAELWLRTIAEVFIRTSHKVANTPIKDIRLPDFVGIINNNYFGYWASAGFILVMLASIGMLKYHTNRATLFENNLNQLHKLQSASAIESVQAELATKLIDNCLVSHSNADTKTSLNPILDAITENTSKILEKVGAKTSAT